MVRVEPGEEILPAPGIYANMFKEDQTIYKVVTRWTDKNYSPN